MTASDATGTRQESVLVVDDTAMNIKILAEALKDRYRVKVAVRGAKALEIAAGDDPPDLILLDVMMPGMDGYEVCRRLKAEEQTRDIPVIFVTARGEVEDEERGLAAGAVDYISKPFHIAIVKARVRNHLELKRKTDLLAKLAWLDGLTQIANRRRFEELLEQEWRRLIRSGEALALLMIDVDHFKAFNDCYGHGAGDVCLQQVAAAMRATAQRPADFIARYGGEEFVVLLPETDAASACQVAERIRGAVSALAIAYAASPVAPQVTVSIGCAAMSPQPGQSPRQLVDAADANLYAAKNAGRNRSWG